MGDDAMKCPRDGDVLYARKYESNIEVDLCGTCHGMWLDKGELEAIEESSEHDYSKELANDPGVAPTSHADLKRQQERGAINCPKCEGPMETREYGYASRIFIDTCVAGCGVWLDEGEIQALEKFFDANRDNRTLPLRWRLWASVLSVLKR
ncbi:MAG: zf-TFIIB domain-containing protein [Deltaproteobacteria bacterium]|nr:zf-TFIIB domain-containing protein [Deltaproteobacteria bacterium]